MMKKIAVLLAFAVLGAFCAPGAQAETIRAEGRYISTHLTHLMPFEAIEVDGEVQVDVRQLPGQEVTVSGRANLAALADVRVENNTLVISYKRPIHIKGKDTLHVSVFMPQITALTAHRGGEINVYGKVETTDIALTATDDADVHIDSLTADNVRVQAIKQGEIDVEHLNTPRLEAAQFDKAEVDLSGYAEKAKLINHGTKDLEADNLRVNEAEVIVNGPGNVEVFAVKTLKASALGRGDIKYHGAPVLTREGNAKKIKPVFED